MRRALVTLDHTANPGRAFHRFCAIFRLLQSKGLFSEASIVSVTNASLYSLPHKFYREMKDQLADEGLGRIKHACTRQFEFESARILHSESPVKEDHVAQLSRYGRRLGTDALVMGSSDRSGLSYWFLGSFAETASLTATVPVLIIKPHVTEADFSKEVRFVVAVDAAVTPSSESIRYLAKAAKMASAQVDLIYVEPAPRALFDSLRQRKDESDATRVMKDVKAALKAHGVSASISHLKETKSIADTIVDFAEKKKAWLTVTIAVKRTRARKILLGSTGRHVLTLTKRPFLAVRTE